MRYTSIESLIAAWCERSKIARKESEHLHTTGYPVESGICFGRQGAIRHCAEDLLHFIDYLQKQVHVVGVGLLSFEERYPLNDSFQNDDQNDKSNLNKKVE